MAESRDNVTCTNTSNSPGISIHKFSSDEVLCQKWTCQKASAKVQAIEVFGSLLGHFETSYFAQVASVVSSSCARRRALEKGSISTRVALFSFSPGPLSSREKRQVSIKDHR